MNLMKVKLKNGLLKRLSYLKTCVDIPMEVGVLKETLSGDCKLCPYCFQTADDKSDFCNICGYDLIHDEKFGLNGVSYLI